MQLCALRTLGRFVDDFAKVPVRIANHISRQLGLPPSLFIAEPERPATASHAARARPLRRGDHEDRTGDMPIDGPLRPGYP